MSRISRYQDSVNKFLKNKSVISKNDVDNIDIITQNLSLCDHLTSILLLTVLNNQAKKKKLKIHGYFMASGIDLMLLLCRITDNKYLYEEEFGKDRYNNVISELVILIIKSLTQNLESVKSSVDDDKIFSKLTLSCNNYLYKKLYEIAKVGMLVSNKKLPKNDITTLNFQDKDAIKGKLLKINKIDKEILNNYVEKKYGYVAQCSLVLGWLLGGGDEKNVDQLEKIGLQFGYILKACYDFKNIETDIKKANKITTNVVINNGIHDTFGVFIENKTKFIEGCITLDIYTNTTKEILDLLEEDLDNCIEKSNIDLKSTYSSFSSI